MENATMKFEVIQLRKLDGDGNLKAFADIAIADAVVIKGLTVVSGKKGIFVSMPRQQGKNGEWFPTVYPLNKEIMEEISKLVLEAYGA